MVPFLPLIIKIIDYPKHIFYVMEETLYLRAFAGLILALALTSYGTSYGLQKACFTALNLSLLIF